MIFEEGAVFLASPEGPSLVWVVFICFFLFGSRDLGFGIWWGRGWGASFPLVIVFDEDKIRVGGSHGGRGLEVVAEEGNLLRRGCSSLLDW